MKIALCLEQTLGHRAHTKNLERSVGTSPHQVAVRHVEFKPRGRSRMPWAVRGSLDAARQLRESGRSDVTFFHTQTVGLAASHGTRGGKYVISVDATPLQMDRMGTWYAHGQQPRALESAKKLMYRRVFRRASGVVAWSNWAADSLERDYGVRPGTVRVLHPGAGPEFFAIRRIARTRDMPNLLFVGGDFRRKGGHVLLDVVAQLGGKASLTLVTGEAVEPMEGVSVISDATPGSAQLLRAYAEADIFCLPTLADCTSVAIGEAMAAGLPVITTTVGSNGDTVQDGQTGLLVAPGDPDHLSDALRRLIEDPPIRAAMGDNARAFAREALDADLNARRLFEFLEEFA